MKKLLSILLMVPAIAFAQSKNKEQIRQIEAVCLNWKSINSVLDKYEEIPFIRGMSLRDEKNKKTQGPLVLFLNPKTLSWTIIEKVQSDLYCVVAIGIDFEAVPSEVIDDMRDRRKKSGV